MQMAAIFVGLLALAATDNSSVKDIAGILNTNAPAEVAAVQADLVAVVEVVEIGEEERLTWSRRASGPQTMLTVFRIKVAVKKVLRAKDSPDAKLTEVEFLSAAVARWRAAPGNQKGAGGVRTGVMVPLPPEAPLKKGEKYIVLLGKTPGKKPRWVLPRSCRYHLEATDENVKKVTESLDVSKWPWGPAVKGLRMAVLLPYNEARMVVRRGAKVGRAHVRLVTAVQNTSKVPVLLNLDPKGTPFTVHGLDAAIRKSTHQPYTKFTIRRLGNVVRIGPGEVVFVGPVETQNLQWSSSLTMAGGTARVHVSCSVSAKAAGEVKIDKAAARGSAKVWSGTMVTKPATITVKKLEITPRKLPAKRT